MFNTIVHVRFGFAQKWVTGKMKVPGYYDVFDGWGDNEDERYRMMGEDFHDKLCSLIEVEGIGYDDAVKSQKTDQLMTRVAELMKQFKVQLEVFFADGRTVKSVEYIKDYSDVIRGDWTEQDTDFVEVTSDTMKYRSFLGLHLATFVTMSMIEDMQDEVEKLL